MFHVTQAGFSQFGGILGIKLTLDVNMVVALEYVAM